MNLHPDGSGRRTGRAGAEVAVLVTALLMLAAYLLLRYGGRWGETDAGDNALTIQAMLAAGRLVPADGPVYPNGYGYQALSVFSLLLGGLSTAQFQLYLQLFLMAWIALPAWLLYRELTGSGRGATLATAILLVQPEFLFFLLRGTHEKFTRGLILLALYLFVKSLGQRHPLPRQAGYLVAFYLAVYGFVAFNNLLAFSLLAALLLALALLAALRWWSRSPVVVEPTAEIRLRYAMLTATVIVFLFTFYFYKPAQHDILVVQSMVDRTASLLLDVERSPGADPYAYTAGAWVSGPVYLVLSLANWILLLVSAVIWLWQSLDLARRRGQGWGPGQRLLWALFGAFTIQGALSMLVDLSGAMSGNLQLRVFPAFAMLAAPLVARSMMKWQGAAQRGRRAAWAATVAALAILALLSVLKASNEPVLSNKWAFYIPAEMQALNRAGVILEDRPLWTEFDERLIAALTLRDSLDPDENLEGWESGGETRNALVSEVIRARGVRLFIAPPIEADSLVIYDNGQAQLYHLRPRTPFQR